MGITVGNGITVGPGIILGGGSGAPIVQSRVAGTPSTNVAQTYTATGATTVTSPTPALGTSVGNFVATSTAKYIRTTTPTPTMTNFGSGDWTFECFINFPALPSQARELFTTENSSGGLGIRIGQSFNSATVNAISIFARAVNDMNYAAYTWPLNTWVFFAVQKSGSTISIWAGTQGSASAAYIGGTSFTGANAGTYTFANGNSNGVYVGAYSGSTDDTNCYLNELCWSNVARYQQTTAAIPIPTSFFTVDSYTTQLLKFQGTNGGTTFTNETS